MFCGLPFASYEVKSQTGCVMSARLSASRQLSRFLIFLMQVWRHGVCAGEWPESG
jgi:hypothetical protein